MAPHDNDFDPEAQPPDQPPQTSEVSRRAFLKTVGVAGAAGSVAGAAGSVVGQSGTLEAQTPPPQAPNQPPRAGSGNPPVERPYMRIRQEVSENLIKRGIVGYADHLRLQPGETIKFMVSSEVPRYRADIVRLLHGDANPAGPGIKEEVVDSPANGEYAGRRQELPLGSYAFVPITPPCALPAASPSRRGLRRPVSAARHPTRSSASRACSRNGRDLAAATASSSTRKAGSRSGYPMPPGASKSWRASSR